MKAWAVVAHGAPLECVELAEPEPKGSDVVLAVTRCGVCHSDLHLWHGGYDLGGGKMLSVKDRGLVLPAAPGHEIVGRVVEFGPDATGISVGDERVVYPWIGCGRCERCAAEQDNLCSQQRSLGVSVNGGFARLVNVPHPRYLFAFDGIDASLAATYACSGLTAYSAVRKVLPMDADQAVVLMGAGGVGLAGIAILKALGHVNIVSVDINANRRTAALAAGASTFVDGTADDVAARVAQVAGTVATVIDFVGSDATAAAALALLPKAGQLVLVGVGGGELTLSVAGTIFRALRVEGSLTGTLQELREVLDLARRGRLLPTPIHEMEKHHANDAMHRLERGHVNGRVVLTDSEPTAAAEVIVPT